MVLHNANLKPSELCTRHHTTILRPLLPLKGKIQSLEGCGAYPHGKLLHHINFSERFPLTILVLTYTTPPL